MSNCILWFLSDGHKKNPNWQNPTILTLYLSDRHQAVVVDGHVSSVKPITAGVPQREQAWSFVIHHLYQWYRYLTWDTCFDGRYEAVDTGCELMIQRSGTFQLCWPAPGCSPPSRPGRVTGCGPRPPSPLQGRQPHSMHCCWERWSPPGAVCWVRLRLRRKLKIRGGLPLPEKRTVREWWCLSELIAKIAFYMLCSKNIFS